MKSIVQGSRLRKNRAEKSSHVAFFSQGYNTGWQDTERLTHHNEFGKSRKYVTLSDEKI